MADLKFHSTEWVKPTVRTPTPWHIVLVRSSTGAESVGLYTKTSWHVAGVGVLQMKSVAAWAEIVAVRMSGSTAASGVDSVDGGKTK